MTETATMPKAPRKPRSARKPRAASALADLQEQVRHLQQEQLKADLSAALEQMAALHDTLTALRERPGCPVSADALTASLFVLGTLDALVRKDQWRAQGE